MAVVVVLLATEWEPSKGGVSAFNQELAAALARVSHQVECVVPSAERREVEAAADLGVTLHSAIDRGVDWGFPESITPTQYRCPNSGLPGVEADDVCVAAPTY